MVIFHSYVTNDQRVNIANLEKPCATHSVFTANRALNEPATRKHSPRSDGKVAATWGASTTKKPQ